MLWLVFSFFVIHCRQKEEKQAGTDPPRDIIVTVDGKGPRALLIPRSLLNRASDATIKQSLQVYLKGKTIPVLGEIHITDLEVFFVPVNRFTPGYTYEVKIEDETVAAVTIAHNKNLRETVVTHIYPSVDTLPENLLKFYIAFSQPMQEGYALENIVLIRNEKDTLKDVFLDIQPELWDSARKMLTLWLDPGRIKRDLQPNKQLGNPLQNGNRYHLLIKQSWQDANGKPLKDSFSKKFITGPRDEMEPDYRGWKVIIPKSGTRDPLKVIMKETLDYGVLVRAIHIHTENGNILDGNIEPREKETAFYFIPDKNWVKGHYTIELQARLEDLAGNNLERLFDKDLEKEIAIKSREQFQIRFNVQ